MFSIFVLLCQSRVKHCLCYCHLILFVGLFLGHCRNNVAISHLTNGSSAILIRSWEVEISFVNGNEFPCATLLPAPSNFMVRRIIAWSAYMVLRVPAISRVQPTHSIFHNKHFINRANSPLIVKIHHHVVSSDKCFCSLSMLQFILPETF